MGMSELPKGWKSTVLGEVVKIKNGYAFSTSDYRKAGVPLIRQSNLNHDTVDLTNCIYLDEEFLRSKSSFILKKNDILIGMSGSIGKLCIYNLDTPALQNQRTGKVEVIENTIINSKFIWRYLCTIEDQLKEKGKGLGVSNVSAKDIKSLPIVIPPINIQEKIVERLELLLGKINKANERLEKIPAILKRFRQSVLASACSGKLTADWREENGCGEWESDKIANVCDTQLGKMLSKKAYEKGLKMLPYLRNANVQWGYFDISDMSVMGFTQREIEKFTLKNNDILMCEGGEIGRCAIWQNQIESCLYQKALHRIRPKRSNLIPKWIYYFFYDISNSGKLIETTSETTIRHLPQDRLVEIIIPLPPVPEQEEIVRRVDKLFDLADKIEQRYKNAKAQLARAEKSIYAKAFRGELVRQEDETKL
jgi:type I restriction enzyme, S subunit